MTSQLPAGVAGAGGEAGDDERPLAVVGGLDALGVVDDAEVTEVREELPRCEAERVVARPDDVLPVGLEVVLDEDPASRCQRRHEPRPQLAVAVAHHRDQVVAVTG
jgi:hypothetical protein